MKHLRFLVQGGGADGEARSALGAFYPGTGVRPNGTARVYQFLAERVFARKHTVLARGNGSAAEQHQADT